MRIIQCFNWNINDINCKEIAEKGFNAIQITPLQPTKDDNSSNWWMCYQPIDFSIGNRFGSKHDLINLCNKAKIYNIKIIADVVLNHVASDDYGNIIPHSKVNNNLLKYLKSSNRICDWSNRWEVINHSIGLPGLRLDNYELQDIIINFLNEYIECGIEGFRFDAAKNISLPEEDNNQFWNRVLNSLKNKELLFNYAEVIFSDKNLIDSYCKYINVLTNSFGSDKNKLIVFVESHDTYLEFGYTKHIPSDILIKEYKLLCKEFPNTLYYARPWDNTWKYI